MPGTGKHFQMWFPLIFPTTPTRRFYYCFPDFIGERTGVKEGKHSICLRIKPGQLKWSLNSYIIHPTLQSALNSGSWDHWWPNPVLCWPDRGASSMQGVPSFSSSLTCLLSFLGSAYGWFWPQFRQCCKEKHTSFLDPHFYPWCLIPSHGPFHWTMDCLSWNLVFSQSFVTMTPSNFCCC